MRLYPTTAHWVFRPAGREAGKDGSFLEFQGGHAVHAGTLDLGFRPPSSHLCCLKAGLPRGCLDEGDVPKMPGSLLPPAPPALTEGDLITRLTSSLVRIGRTPGMSIVVYKLKKRSTANRGSMVLAMFREIACDSRHAHLDRQAQRESGFKLGRIMIG